MEGEAFVAVKPLAHLGVLVGGVIVQDHMRHLSSRNLGLDGVEEADEHDADGAACCVRSPCLDHVEGGEQRCGSVALVIMGHGPGAALFERQPRLSAVERLDLTLFVDAEHDGMRRRVDSKRCDWDTSIGCGWRYLYS